MVALSPVVTAPALLAARTSLNDRVQRLLEQADYRRADAPQEKDAVYRLRYAAYLREGAIPENSSGRFSDALDETDNAWTFGVYLDGELASSIRLHVASRQTPALPALNVFSDLLSPEVAAGRIIIDPTRFVADRVMSRRHPELCYVTTRLAWLASEYFRANLLLATVRAEHQAFYRRVFGHRLICEPRHYPSLTKPICLMALDYAFARERVLERQPFFRSTVFERRMLFARAAAAPALRSAA
jgi:hypothetical protein